MQVSRQVHPATWQEVVRRWAQFVVAWHREHYFMSDFAVKLHEHMHAEDVEDAKYVRLNFGDAYIKQFTSQL